MASCRHARIPDKCRLLHGPYHAPPLARGDRATCLLRDGDVVITGWTSAHIPWPRCQAVGVKGGSGVLLDEELARAVRTEAAAAVGCWWGVTRLVVVHETLPGNDGTHGGRTNPGQSENFHCIFRQHAARKRRIDG